MSVSLTQPLLAVRVTSPDCGIFGAPRPKCRQIKEGTVAASEATRKHLGADLRAQIGDAVFACADGKCTFSGFDLPGAGRQNATQEGAAGHEFDGNGGLMVFIDHGEGTETRYMHLSELSVPLGATVQRGQQIGLAGDTGDAKGGPHLHFEVIQEGEHVDPIPLLLPAGSRLGDAMLAIVGIGGLALLGWMALT